MTLAFFKYGLPLLLGYTLFVGIAGRLNPFARPYYREERASRLLGIWTGLSTSVVLASTLHLAYGMSVEDARALLLPAGMLLLALIIPALMAFAFARRRFSTATRAKPQSRFNWAIAEEDVQQTINTEQQLQAARTEDLLMAPASPDSSNKANNACDDDCVDVGPAYLETVTINRMSDVIQAEAVNDADQTGAQNGVLITDSPSCQDKPAQLATLPEDQSEDKVLVGKLAAETALREESEKHMRIMRKALSVLEADTRHHSIDKANAIIELEEQLAASIERAADCESDAIQEKRRRIEIEQHLVEMKQRMVKAKQEIRHSAAARASALSTANKSIAFARQSVQIRTHLEKELQEAKSTVDNRQKTISSLIQTLEKEKRKTQSDIHSAAKQLVLHEKQLKARRTLEEVARSVENKLASRLVKKVAKARPLASDMNQGEASQ